MLTSLVSLEDSLVTLLITDYVVNERRHTKGADKPTASVFSKKMLLKLVPKVTVPLVCLTI